jgi:hypothetical protein
MHHTWTIERWTKLRSRVADLKNAYKQVAVTPEHKSFDIIAGWDPVGKQARLFRAHAMTFGLTAPCIKNKQSHNRTENEVTFSPARGILSRLPQVKKRRRRRLRPDLI